jgi:hypothetical protein
MGNDHEDAIDPGHDLLLFGICLCSNRGAHGWQADKARETAGADGL